MDRAVDVVFFDIGGVMYDDTVYARALDRALRELGASFDDAEFAATYAEARAAQSGSFRDTLARRFLGPSADVEAVERAASKHWAYPPGSLYPDVRPCLRELADAYRLGIVANQPSAVREALERDGVARFIELWNVSADVGLEKPDPRLYARAVAAAEVPAERTAMVGDRLDRDIRPARDAGMRTVWVLRGEAPDRPTAAQLAEPDAAIADLGRLASALDRLGPA
ncbi:MAG TPA: HAD family hydrolase [Actinomycetota bacterium]|jgi:putative hydrolase of the HAD superfamily